MKNPDPFQFRNEGLAGKVIGALFGIIFSLLIALGIGVLQSFKLGNGIIVSNKNLTDAVKGFSAMADNWGNSMDELTREIQGRPARPYRPASAAPSEGGN